MDFAALNTVAEPSSIEDVQIRFPLVEFSPVAWNNSDPCSGCAEQGGPWEPPAAEAFLVYRWHGRWVKQPVAACCLEQELACVVRSDAVTELSVQVLVFAELKVV